MATLPRQPRAGLPANLARTQTVSGQFWVQVRNSSSVWINAMRVTDATRASTIATRLNNIFAISTADLDFITPSFDIIHNSYTVVWSGARWDSRFLTTTRTGSTNEYLYMGCHFSRNDIINAAFRDKSHVQLARHS